MSSSGRSKDSLSRLLERIPASVPDAELEDFIANLILQQSKQRGEQYDRKGISAYLDDQPGPSNRSKAASTNKSFLASVIRNVEGHNNALLRQQIADTQRAVRDERKRDTSREKSTATDSSRSRLSEKEHEHQRLKKSADQDKYSSKMDKYFSKNYDPALDISVDDLTDGSTGLIAADEELSLPAWDRISTVLTPDKSAKEGKRQRKEERDRIRALRSARRESRDKLPKRDRSRSPSPRRRQRDGESRRSSRSKHKSDDREKQRRHTSKSKEQPAGPTPPTPKVREWDLGKNLSF